jgi:DsbE subfamily thiol:disulfide oxidoreductase
MRHLKAFGIVFAVIMISTVIILSSQGAQEESAMNVADRATSAPEWSLKDVHGKTVRSTDFKGKVVILDFWATWCGPCRAEIPNFIALQKQYAKQGLVVVGLSVDEESADVVKPFAQKLGVNYPVVLADEKTREVFGGIEAVPTTFIVDRKGRIVKKHMGFADKDEFENEIKPLLNP